MPSRITVHALDGGADVQEFEVRRIDGEVIGTARLRKAARAVWIEDVEVRPELRGWGYGSEAVEQIEAVYPGVVFAARVRPADGLNLYFWLRLGYRPATAEDAVGDPRGDGSITMIRKDGE
jgi:hypothetical protein